MPNDDIENFRKAVTAGTPVEAIARAYGLVKGPGETEVELAKRVEQLRASQMRADATLCNEHKTHADKTTSFCLKLKGHPGRHTWERK